MRIIKTDRRQWHKWFAWHPVTVDEGEVVWFETVMRRKVLQETPYDSYMSDYEFWEHKAIG